MINNHPKCRQLLRQKAEMLLENTEPSPDPSSFIESQHLLHELEVHQVELEMQNEMLSEAQTEIEQGQRFTDLYNFSPVAYFSLHSDSSLMMTNQSGANLLGVDKALVLEQSPALSSFVCTESLPAFRDFLSLIFASPEVQSCEIKMHRKDDDSQIETVIYGVADEARNIANISVTDITRWKQLENEIRQRDEYGRAVLNNIPFLLWLKDARSRFLAVNELFATNFGFKSSDELIGKTDFDITTPALAEAFRADDQKVLRSGASLRLEEQVETGGELKWFETYKSPIHIGELTVGTVGYSRDISEQRKMLELLRDSEMRYRTMAENSADWIWVIDLTGHCTYSNQRVTDMLGYAHDEILAMDPLTLVHPEDVGLYSSTLQTAIRTQSGWDNIFIRFKAKNGSYRILESRASPLFDTQKILVAFQGADRDVTERRFAEESIARAKAEAEQANLAKSKFLAAASHDLRQPLTALTLYVGLLKSRLDGKEEVITNNMSNCISSLNELLSDLLDLSKLEAGVVVPKKSDFLLVDLLDGLFAVHMPEARLKGLELRMHVSEEYGFTDLVLFKRIIGNLISNSIRYTNTGGVLVACRRHQGKFWVEVWDTGVGIPEGKQEEIFDEFKQLGNGARNRGSGLGLAIVAKAAKLLNLQIRVRSRPGKGSMFAIELPLGEQIHNIVEAPVSNIPLQIALVDDNPEVLNGIAITLEMLGHTVIAATSGAALLELLGGNAPDMVISDYRLGGNETGFDVIAELRARFNEKLPAMIITGDTDPKIMRSMADRGIVVQHKPFEMSALQFYIEQATHRFS